MSLSLLDRILEAAPETQDVADKILELARVKFEYPGYAAVWSNKALELGKAISKIQALADLIARASMRLAVKGPQPVDFSAGVPRVLATEAVQDLMERAPVLVSSREEVILAYGSEQHAFTAVRAVDQTIVEKVHETLINAMIDGKPVESAATLVASVAQWSQAYARLVVRNAATTSYSAGRLREAEIMQREGTLAGLRYVSALDVDTRKNHRAAHGVEASVDDPVWNTLTPPMGPNCRCTLTPVVGKELRPARIPPGAYPDPGYGQRPVVYGG